MIDPTHILLVEDNPGDARLLREELAESGQRTWPMAHVQRLSEAVEKLGSEPFDVVLLDLSLPDSRGLETVTRTVDASPDVAVVVLTGNEDEATALEAVRQGAQDYLIKGQTSGPLLRRAIRYAIQRKAAQRERDRLIARLREALARVKQLSGLLPMCAWCKRIRDDQGYWQQVEQYIDEHSEAEFTSGICPECAKKVYDDFFDGESGPESPREPAE